MGTNQDEPRMSPLVDPFGPRSRCLMEFLSTICLELRVRYVGLSLFLSASLTFPPLSPPGARVWSLESGLVISLVHQ